MKSHSSSFDKLLVVRCLVGDPAINVGNCGPNDILVNAATLSEGQEIIVAEKLRDVLPIALK